MFVWGSSAILWFGDKLTSTLVWLNDWPHQKNLTKRTSANDEMVSVFGSCTLLFFAAGWWIIRYQPTHDTSEVVCDFITYDQHDLAISSHKGQMFLKYNRGWMSNMFEKKQIVQHDLRLDSHRNKYISNLVPAYERERCPSMWINYHPWYTSICINYIYYIIYVLDYACVVNEFIFWIPNDCGCGGVDS